MENNQLPAEVSLCLSGGAARGAFHLGAISVLERNHIKIQAISGASIGALIGASLACGKSSQEIFTILKSKEFKKVFKFSFAKGYLFEIDMDAKILDALIDKKHFNELDIFLDIAVVNVDDAKVEYFNSGDTLRETILASCAISPMIKAVAIQNTLYADGGILDNFPVERLKHLGHKIIGINLFPNDTKRPKSIFAWINKMLFLMWHAKNLDKSELCDIFVTDEKLNELSTFTFRDLDKAYALGEMQMQKVLEGFMKSKS